MTKWFDGFLKSITERALTHRQEDRWILYLTRCQLNVFLSNQTHGNIGARYWELTGNIFVLHQSYEEELLTKAKAVSRDRKNKILKILSDIEDDIEDIDEVEDAENEKMILLQARRILIEKLEHRQ